MDKACHCKVIKRLNEQFTMKACHLEPQHAYVSGQGMCVTSKIAKRRQQIHDRVVNRNDNGYTPESQGTHSLLPTGNLNRSKFQANTNDRKKHDHRHVFSQFNELKKINIIITLLPTTSELVTTNGEN